MDIFVDSKIDFLRWRYHAIAFSLIFIAIGFVMLFTRGINLGIDFAGGANVILRFQDQPPIQELRNIVADATIQQYGPSEEHSVLIRLPQLEQEGDYAGQVVANINERLNPEGGAKLDLNYQGRASLSDLLKERDPDNRGVSPDAMAHYDDLAQRVIARRSEIGIFKSMDEVTSVPGVSPAVSQVLRDQTFLGSFKLLYQVTVGPQVGRELQRKALWAVILATLAMGAYIAVRFDFKFGVAAVLCLIHDTLFSIAFLGMIYGTFEIITVAAFLMIIGYSINDTVVIYDRVRENVKKTRTREDFATVINRAMNQTLSRTILTGGSVILVLVSLIIWGGEVTSEFAILLLVGTIAGTLSTLTVVPAIVLAWNRRFASKGTYSS